MADVVTDTGADGLSGDEQLLPDLVLRELPEPMLRLHLVRLIHAGTLTSERAMEVYERNRKRKESGTIESPPC